jgi:hypothetical protein
MKPRRSQQKIFFSCHRGAGYYFYSKAVNVVRAGAGALIVSNSKAGEGSMTPIRAAKQEERDPIEDQLKSYSSGFWF